MTWPDNCHDFHSLANAILFDAIQIKTGILWHFPERQYVLLFSE